MKLAHVISVSGGKDSTALALLAVERQIDPEHTYFVFADTGNELQITIDYVEYLSQYLQGRGYRGIQTVKADFSRQLAVRASNIERTWADMPPSIVADAKAMLTPTGIPFLDLCLWKGRFPSTMARFCTAELKSKPVHEHVIEQLLDAGSVLEWHGVRADESPARAKLSEFEIQFGSGTLDDLEGHAIWRPILAWSVVDVFDMHLKHGVDPNPLYSMGSARVGCAPCIHARKSEIKNLAARFPAEIDRLRRWEMLVGLVSRRRKSTFFPTTRARADGIDAVVEWSKTSRGGRQMDLMAEEEPAQCSSIYGLCE